MAGKYRKAVDASIRAGELDVRGVDAAFVAAARGVADLLDEQDRRGAVSSTSLSRFTSVSKDLRRRIDATAAAKRRREPRGAVEAVDVEVTSPAKLQAVEESSLDRIRKQRRA